MLLHRIVINVIQLQVAVFFVTFQNTLALKIADYMVTDQVNQYGQLLLIRGYGRFESDQTQFFLRLCQPGSCQLFLHHRLTATAQLHRLRMPLFRPAPNAVSAEEFFRLILV